ncbi:hypothetical protein QUC31_012022 [Theobroma cacao]|uniref:Uncharacterized protein LOC18595613 isoform X1 n=2 Tax=Theobroma cacao TaxID=3641 RepID=A0AB32UYT5_THECC|nr:PREDICTED: uncharacterized protein LOC18595613 isoform X1 [Theobroma cacao]EOY26331.1 Serine/arginine repetitive matrix protein 2, putative isoform 1 [Theobroma cacao]
MARSLSQTVIKLSLVTKPRPSSRLLPLRTLSNQPNHSDPSDPSSDTSSSDPLLQKLEDAIHRIIVRRSAPDWLPFIPGSSYWVPPSTAQSYGLAQLVEKLANPLTPEESMSTTTVRGWPSSEYFIKEYNVLYDISGGTPHSVELNTSSNTASKSEDEEG